MISVHSINQPQLHPPLILQYRAVQLVAFQPCGPWAPGLGNTLLLPLRSPGSLFLLQLLLPAPTLGQARAGGHRTLLLGKPAQSCHVAQQERPLQCMWPISPIAIHCTFINCDFRQTVPLSMLTHTPETSVCIRLLLIPDAQSMCHGTRNLVMLLASGNSDALILQRLSHSLSPPLPS